MNVAHCKNSTLREVYVALSGLPGPVTLSEFSTLRTRFEREWPEHQFSSPQDLLPAEPNAPPDADLELSPQWFGQLAWGSGRWIGRWGHRTLALHRVLVEDERYRTFSEDVLPTLHRWLTLGREAYAFAGLDPAVTTAHFGYVNGFTLPPDASDLSEWFRFNFAIEAAGAAKGLAEVSVGVAFPRPELQARVSIQLSAQQDDGTTRVVVHTVVERDVDYGARFQRGEDLLEEVDRARLLAKETFFSFVTDRALTFMEATDVEFEA
jgi:hypothetical protein